MTDEESVHLRNYKKTVMHVWLAVLVGILMAVIVSVGVCRWLASSDILRIEKLIISSRCECKLIRVEANGNVINQSFPRGALETLTDKFLKSEARSDDVSRVVQPVELPDGPASGVRKHQNHGNGADGGH